MFIVQCQETLAFLVRANTKGATLGTHIEATVFHDKDDPNVLAFKAQGTGITIIFVQA